MKDPKSSPVLRELARTQAAKTPSDWPGRFIFVAGAILMLTGTGLVLGASASAHQLGIHDPILGVPFRYLMLSVGMAELLVAFLCLFTNKRALSLGLMAWLAAVFLAYRIGLWNEGWHHSSGFMVAPLNLSPRMTDAITSLTLFILLIGSCIMLMKVLWRPRMKPSTTSERNDFLKIPCPQCGGRIEFPSSGIGQKIACPHCAATITLQKSA